MKKLFLLSLTALFAMGVNVAFAQDKDAAKEDEGYVFTNVKELPVTSVKNQNKAGTCWCYSGLGFIEAELLRMGKGEYDFSEMYIVANTYNDRAKAAVRTHGDVSFSQGGSFYDVIYGMKTFGLVPESEMRPGAAYGDTLSDHSELSALTDAMVKAIATGDHKKLQTNGNEVLWQKAVAAVHEIYLGKNPENFSYNGKQYTPKSFYESLGLNADDYVSITYTHHPFYEKIRSRNPRQLALVTMLQCSFGWNLWISSITLSKPVTQSLGVLTLANKVSAWAYAKVSAFFLKQNQLLSSVATWLTGQV